jgi:hypothetical protein
MLVSPTRQVVDKFSTRSVAHAMLFFALGDFFIFLANAVPDAFLIGLFRLIRLFLWYQGSRNRNLSCWPPSDDFGRAGWARSKVVRLKSCAIRLAAHGAHCRRAFVFLHGQFV